MHGGTRERVERQGWVRALTVSLLMAALGLGLGGCMKSLSGGWAQNSPVLKPESTRSTVMLGARE